jgi:glucan phosphoethanolaminetransferase (alkaline phosphatase superfamily)
MSLFTLPKNRATSLIHFFFLISLISACDFIFFIGTKQYSLAIFGALACLSLLLLPVVIFRKNLRLYLLLLLPVFLLAPFNLSSIILFDVPINDATIMLLINTNTREAMELIKGYLPQLSLCFVLYFGGLYVLFRRIPRAVPAKTTGSISMYSFGIFVLLPLIDLEEGSYFSNLSARFYTVFPTSVFYAGKMVYKQYRFVNASKEKRDNYVFNIKQDSAVAGRQVSVLIIGESARYDHWGINGYEKNTSPCLSKRNNLISFQNTAAGGFITEYAVPLILTGVGADYFDAHYQQKGIVGAFREAGFKTYWLTNQLDEGHIKLHIDEAESKFLLQSDARATKNLHRDMELVQVLKKVLSEPGEKKFIVLHTSGSHYDYSARYPEEFDRMKPSNKTVFSKSADRKFKDVLVNSYDNSILYSDAVIDSTISLVAEQNAYSSVTYISDHGENLFDDGRSLSQHAYPVPSKYIGRIPFFIWYSPTMENTYPDKITHLKQKVDAKVSSENIIHTLTDLNGLYYSAQDSLKNLAGPFFQNSPQRIMGANKKVYSYSLLD